MEKYPPMAFTPTTEETERIATECVRICGKRGSILTFQQSSGKQKICRKQK